MIILLILEGYTKIILTSWDKNENIIFKRFSGFTLSFNFNIRTIV